MAKQDLPKLSQRQLRVLRALVLYPTVRGAARAAEVPERTVYRWLRKPGFRQKLEEAEQDPLGATRARSHDLATDALHVLDELMTDRATPAALRIEAARIFLEHVAPIRES